MLELFFFTKKKLWVKWQKGQKFANKKPTFDGFCQRQYLREKLQNIFQQLGQNRVNYYLDIGNFFFYQKQFYGNNANLEEEKNLGLNFSFCFKTQIGRQHFFIIWQERQTPDKLFFTKLYPNGFTGKQLILESQIEEKKTHLLHYAKTAIVLWKTFKTFLTTGPNKSELLFKYW